MSNLNSLPFVSPPAGRLIEELEKCVCASCIEDVVLAIADAREILIKQLCGCKQLEYPLTNKCVNCKVINLVMGDGK